MGGKTKHTQRTKNNVKPSNSARSAEFLGVTPSFVGFSVHTDLGLVPFAPGFSTSEQLTEVFDPSLSPEIQLILRKLTKKDPITKKKALQEFAELLNTLDVDIIKDSILPIWPKHYQNLATDPEHNIRELTQNVLQILVGKCKKLIAPYLKQIIPVWIASHFDSYAPAASIASSTFRETFAGNANRTQEVCLHCQSEIIDYAARNLNFHTAATLSAGKNLATEEADSKYQRVVLGSLKLLSFFLQHTAKVEDLSQIYENMQKMVIHQKFWTLSKHKVPSIKAASFEFYYYLLQNEALCDVLNDVKVQLITVSLQNIDESDPIVAPHIWGSILLLQTKYDNWYESINFKKIVASKVSHLAKNAFNNNAEAICPNLLPFFSKLTKKSLQDINVQEYQKRFFDDMKQSIVNEINVISKSDYAIIIKSYFECLRFLLQKIYNNEQNDADDELAKQLLQDNILDIIKWYLKEAQQHPTKYFFQQTSALIAYMCERQTDGTESTIYAQLLNNFWNEIFRMITQSIEKQELDENYLENVIDLIKYLHLANSSFEEHKVQFKDQTNNENHDEKHETIAALTKDNKNFTFIQKELKQLVIQLLQISLNNIKEERCGKYLTHIRSLSKLYTDYDFYAAISIDGCIETTFQIFCDLLKILTRNDMDLVVDIIFELLQRIDETKRYEYISENLLKINKSDVQTSILQRLLSHPLCADLEIRKILLSPASSEIIINIAKSIIENDNARSNINLLYKCFFQIDTGDILINSKTVDAIIDIITQPLISDYETNDIVDFCGSFISQIMPVICSNNNSSKLMQHQAFIRLFQFSIECIPNDYISEDTIWEMTTCWQDALSSEDIIIDINLLTNCANIIEKCINNREQFTTQLVDTVADAIAKFIICSTEIIDDENLRLQKIDEYFLAFFNSNINTKEIIRNLTQFTSYIEAINATITPIDELTNDCIKTPNLKLIYRRTILNFCTIFKLVCRVKTECIKTNEIDEENTEDYCDPNENLIKNYSNILIDELIKCLNIAAMGDSLLNNLQQPLDNEFETITIELSESIKLLISNATDLFNILKEKLIENASNDNNLGACRPLYYLLYAEQYKMLEESASIVLIEELFDYFIERNALKSYLNITQYMLKRLSKKTLTTKWNIMQKEPNEIWLQAAIFRCLIENNFNGDYNEIADKNIIDIALQFFTTIANKQLMDNQNILLYKEDITTKSFSQVITVVEYINLMIIIVNKFAQQLTLKNWDTVRLGLTSWLLSVTKSIDNFKNPKISLFITSVYKLYASVNNFILEERKKSSTEILKSVIDEWDAIFAQETDLVAFKSFFILYNREDKVTDESLIAVLNEITPAAEYFNCKFIYDFCKQSTQFSLDIICNFLLNNLSNPIHCLRITCYILLRNLTKHFIVQDIEIFSNKSENVQNDDTDSIRDWHYLCRFENYIQKYDKAIEKYLNEFSFKLTDFDGFETMDTNKALSYLLLWNNIIYICEISPVTLRAVYTTWLYENKYIENFMRFLFRTMPIEILKNYDSKIMYTDMFKGFQWIQLKDKNINIGRYACYLYLEFLRKLPAVSRKWWTTSSSRQKSFVDKLTSNYVSHLICSDELKEIAKKKDIHENMQVTVHNSTREVLAVYTIEEVRMELVITLAINYPLGGIKVECGKQIGGRANSRNVAMQLSIFLTHQNGTIINGLSLWKKNLDKKFEGVEECYICYMVIHQDSCELPKLTCKTCKKKFHGSCLYQWFTTSSKSSCPICRNVF